MSLCLRYVPTTLRIQARCHRFASHIRVCALLISDEAQPCYSDSEYMLESALCMSTTRNNFLRVQIDGIELMTELLQNEGWSHIPIIGKQVMPTY